MKIICSLMVFVFCLSTQAEETETSFKATVGPFYDGNVGQSVAFSNSGFDGEGNQADQTGHSGGGGHIALPAGPPTSTVYVDWGAIATLNYDPTMIKSGNNEYGLTAELDSSSYQTYQTYNFESLKLGPTWQNDNRDRSATASLYYQSTFYQGIYSQDYLKLDSLYTLKTSSPEVSVGLNFSQYLRTHSTAFTVNLPLTASFKLDSFTISLGFNPGFGGGSPTLFYQQNMGAPPSVVGGDEFARFWQSTYSLSLEEKFTDRLSASLSFSETQNNYLQENVPFTNAPGVFYAARTDILVSSTFDLKYQIKPDKWSCNLSASFTRSWASGYQGLPSSGGGPPSYNFDRPYAFLTLIYEI